MKNATTSIKSKINGAAVHAVEAHDTAVDSLKARLAKARAEAKALRAENEALHAKVHAVEAEEAGIKYETEAQRQLQSALDSVLGEFEVPSLPRALAGFALAIAVAAGCGWLIGVVVNAAMMFALAVTGSTILAFMIWLVGIVCSAVAGMIAGGAAYNFIVSGNVDKMYNGAKDKVLGLFKAKPSFTGLFTKGEAA